MRREREGHGTTSEMDQPPVPLYDLNELDSLSSRSANGTDDSRRVRPILLLCNCIRPPKISRTKEIKRVCIWHLASNRYGWPIHSHPLNGSIGSSLLSAGSSPARDRTANSDEDDPPLCGVHTSEERPPLLPHQSHQVPSYEE